MDTLGMTSRLVAAARERESARPDRLFSDPYAGALAGDEGREMLAMIETVSGPDGEPKRMENSYLAIRTRFLDDMMQASQDSGIRQFAILAAGMDARAFRLDWREDSVLFEVERAEVLNYKETILKKLNARPAVRRVTVTADLREDFSEALRDHGFQPKQPTAFLLEGLLPYLPGKAAAREILGKIAAIAAPASTLGLDCISQSFLTSHWTRAYLEMMESHGIGWHFGTDSPEELLESCGFIDVHVRQPAEVQPGRWPFPALSRAMPDIPRSFLVTAAK